MWRYLARILALLVTAAMLRLGTAAALDEPVPVALAGDAWAVVVSTSRFWFNLRHTADALGVYAQLRRLGVPDERVILFLAEDHTASPKWPGGGGSDSDSRGSAPLDGAPPLVDYAGADVTPDALLRVLSGRHPPGTPPSRMLRSGRNDTVLLYLTGHGGDGFLKFADKHELAAEDLAAGVALAAAAGRFGELLLLADTCQASTLVQPLASAGVLALTSSVHGENSYAHGHDARAGQSTADGFTHALLQFLDERLRALGAAVHAAAAAAAVAAAGDVEAAGSAAHHSHASHHHHHADSRSAADVCADPSDPRFAALARLCTAHAPPAAAGAASPAATSSSLSCGSARIMTALPAFASLARAAEAALLRLRGAAAATPLREDDAQTACVRAAWALVHQLGVGGADGTVRGPRAGRGAGTSLLPAEAALARTLAGLLVHAAHGAAPHRAAAGAAPPQQQPWRPRGGGAALWSGSVPPPPQAGLSLGALFRATPSWRTASTTYARTDLAASWRVDAAWGATPAAARAAALPALQDPQALQAAAANAAEAGAAVGAAAQAADAAARAQAAALALLDGVHLMDFFA